MGSVMEGYFTNALEIRVTRFSGQSSVWVERAHRLGKTENTQGQRSFTKGSEIDTYSR